MTHTRSMSESEGTFGPVKPCESGCPNCHQRHVTYRVWESSDGGYEDYQYTCAECGHRWWVDGIDS